ncbi:MAG: hypothetical protein U0667_10895 [Chloroflexota bacterium]
MQLHRPRIAATATAIGALLLAPLIQPGGSAAQSTAPSATPLVIPVPTSSSDSMCGVDWGLPLVRVDGRTIYATPRYQAEDPAPELATNDLDVVAGQELVVDVDGDVPLARLPIDSLVATLRLGDDPARWLVTQVTGDTATISIPADTAGEGELAFRVGTCGSWSIAGRYPITVADATAAAECPTDQAGLQRWLDSMDQRANLYHGVIPTLGIVNIRSRWTDVTLHDSGSSASLPYDPDTPVIEARAAYRITLRPVDPGLVPTSVEVQWLEVPPDAELRAGALRTLEPAGRPARARLTDDGTGISVRVPTAKGRYLLSSSSGWQDRCVVATETSTFAIVESR